MTRVGSSRPLGRPYCNQCGYDLTGLTESSKCPECGSPFVDALMRPQLRLDYYRYQSERTFAGLPLVSIARGADPDGTIGRARGIIAIGDVAVGVIAIGGRAYGGLTVGGVGVGVVSIGGLSAGGITIGGMSVGLLALGGLAAGGAAIGGQAIGLFFALGGSAIQLLR